jgi:hypothetical protein
MRDIFQFHAILIYYSPSRPRLIFAKGMISTTSCMRSTSRKLVQIIQELISSQEMEFAPDGKHIIWGILVEIIHGPML